MILSIFTIALAILVVGFLIFIHELGHYYVARWVGIRVTAFGIGFGKPIRTWVRDGVEWRLNRIPFGGYVQLAGSEEGEGQDPYEMPDGYLGKSPWDRIKVVAAGPLVNILFALLLFTLIWMAGGRTKSFSEVTTTLGWIQPKSELYEQGVRPGDVITAYDGFSVRNARDHLYGLLNASEQVKIEGIHKSYVNAEDRPFQLTVTLPEPEEGAAVSAIGVQAPADYLIYQPGRGPLQALAKGSPLAGSGIEPGDRVIWANGSVIFSQRQLAHLMNRPHALLSIMRDQQILLRRAPRVEAQQIRLLPAMQDELTDWRYAAGLQKQKIGLLYILPYDLTDRAVVEKPLRFIDQEAKGEAFPAAPETEMDASLQPGDRIVAVNGQPVQYAYEVLQKLQSPSALLIVQRGLDSSEAVGASEAQEQFMESVDWAALGRLVSSLASSATTAPRQEGNLLLLESITPKPHAEFVTSEAAKEEYTTYLKEVSESIESISSPRAREKQEKLFGELQERVYLTPPFFFDRKVTYNPNPFVLFADICRDFWTTLKALLTGHLSPKWISGPVGLVNVVQQSAKSSIVEGLFWVGAISLNLGLLNLLPIPILDGGRICFAFWEMLTKRRIAPKTMERMMVPFALLLLALLTYTVINDVGRIFGW